MQFLFSPTYVYTSQCNYVFSNDKLLYIEVIKSCRSKGFELSSSSSSSSPKYFSESDSEHCSISRAKSRIPIL